MFCTSSKQVTLTLLRNIPCSELQIYNCTLEKSLLLLIVSIVIEGPDLPDLAIKINETGNADTLVLQILSQRFAYIIKSVNEDDEKSGY